MTAANESTQSPGATVPDLWREASGLGPARPFLTYYDDHSGERVELSYATFDNWVAKTANLIQDELALAPGDEIALLLPTHWQTPIWLLACWTAGVVASVGEDPDTVARAAAVVAGPEALDLARTCGGERIALALRPLGAPFAEVPAGFTDYAAVVPGCADHFTAYEPVTAAATALAADGRSWTHGELTARRGVGRGPLGPVGSQPGLLVAATRPIQRSGQL